MNIKEQYNNYNKTLNRKIIFVWALVICIVLFCLAFKTDMSIWQSGKTIVNFIFNSDFDKQATAAEKVIVYLRLPRVCLAVLSGIGLAVAGTVMQSVTRNFLVSPFTLGVSSAAAFGASLCIVFGSATIFFYDIFIIGSAFSVALLSMLVIFIITKKIGATANSVILIGIALNYFFAALTASLQFFAQENKLAAVVQWTFGTFNRANWDAVIIIGVIIAFSIIFMKNLILKWNVMANSEDELVKSLGLNPEKLRSTTMVLAVLITATIISFTGVIGFVGLIAPHIARFIVGNDHRFLLTMSAGIGASLLVVSDTIGKFILYPVNVPVGIVVSFVGVPVFIHLILKNRKSGI